MIDSIGIKSQDVLFKAFNYSDLVSILKELGMSYNLILLTNCVMLPFHMLPLNY